jgi:hypothetical protein
MNYNFPGIYFLPQVVGHVQFLSLCAVRMLRLGVCSGNGMNRTHAHIVYLRMWLHTKTQNCKSCCTRTRLRSIFTILYGACISLKHSVVYERCFECAVGGIRHPQQTQTGSNSSTIAVDSSNGVTNTRCCRYPSVPLCYPPTLSPLSNCHYCGVWESENANLVTICIKLRTSAL